MAHTQRSDNREDYLNDSWVELHFQQQSAAQSAEGSPQPALARPMAPSTMEKLLLEAQREFSRGSSRVGSATSTAASSRGSPKSPHSPNNEPSTLGLLSEISTIQEQTSSHPEQETAPSEWVQEWASRPEAVPPREWGSNFKHPRRHKLSVRNSDGLLSLKNLPLLLLTHACTFFLGAATMLFILKKYCKWAAVVTTQIE